MPLLPGSRLGSYEIVAPLGAGGMGEVYRARDTSLRRDVAIKVLPDLVEQDSERLLRFEREARTLASLNHPNIAQVYGLERSSGVPALVMELVEGPTLADRIAQGPVPPDEALAIAKQIAEALDAAHQQGIVHRDLKPANIKVRPDGAVKVLDFGLAKVAELHAAAVLGSAPAGLSQSPTITSPALVTGGGVLLGTAAYMSPEQARGRSVDRRTDIWAFGCVLYEMLSGRLAFDADGVTDTVAAILTRDPDWRSVPHRFVRLIQRCLQKDPAQRLRDIGDAFLLLDEAMPHARSVSRRTAITAGGTMLGALGVALWAPWRVDEVRDAFPWDINLVQPVDLALGPTLIISPDARTLIFVGRKDGGGVRQLIRKDVGSPLLQPLAGTENASYPFFSPDGSSVGFFADSRLWKIRLAGGEVSSLCKAVACRGAAWTEDGRIVAALDTRVGLSILPESGGTPQPLTSLNAGRREFSHRMPYVIPGGNAVVFSSSTDPSSWTDADIGVVPLTDRTPRIVLEGAGAGARYIASGHLLYANTGRLFAVPFDRKSLKPTGKPVTVLEGVAANIGTGTGFFDVSANGYLVYQSGAVVGALTVEWRDKDGKSETILSDPNEYQHPSLSPNGKYVAVRADDGITVHNLSDGRPTKLTTSGSRRNNAPVWSPDSRYVLFRGDGEIWWAQADGAKPAQLLVRSSSLASPLAISPSWHLAYSEQVGTGARVMVAPLDARTTLLQVGSAVEFTTTPSANILASFSRDGRWLAYTSAPADEYEVYVRAFPNTGQWWPVSRGGGHMPVWSKTRQELFYRTANGIIMVVPYTIRGGNFEALPPREWSPKPIAQGGLVRAFDLGSDGRILAIAAAESRERPNHAKLIVNFFDEVRRQIG